MAYPCKQCLLSMTCNRDCTRIVITDNKRTLQRFQKNKRCLDCGHLFFKVYTPKNNNNLYKNRFSPKEFYDHFYIKCLNCRTIFLVEIEYWYGELKKQKYGIERIGKIELFDNLDENKHNYQSWIRGRTIEEDYNEAFEIRGNKLLKMIKFGLEKT